MDGAHDGLMRVISDKTEQRARTVHLNLGHRGDLVCAVNTQHDLNRGRLVCHVYPGNPSLALDLLRSLGKRSDSPGWPEPSSAWGSVEPWVAAARITDLFVFPADDINSTDIDRLRALAGVKRVWLLSRVANSPSSLTPKNLLEQIEVATDDGSSREEEWRLRDLPDRAFVWPESVVLARYEALTTLNPTEFRDFDDTWTTAKEKTHSLLALRPQVSANRWLPMISTRWDGSACPAAVSGVFAAFLDENENFPPSVDSSIELFRNPIQWARSSSSPEVLASAALTGLGLKIPESQALRLGQMRIANRRITLLGTQLPTEISSALLPQLVKRLRAGARSGEPLFPSKPGLFNQMAVHGAGWQYRRTVDPKRGESLGQIQFEKRARGMRSLPDMCSLRYLRKLLEGPEKYGVLAEKLSNDRHNHSFLLEIGATYRKGACVRASDALLFSLQRERTDPIRVRAQIARNTAALEDEKLGSGRPKAEH